MKKIALLILTLGIVLLLFGGWLVMTNKAYNQAAERRIECDLVYGEQPANVREKETCVAESKEIEQSYHQKAYTSIGVGLVVVTSSLYVYHKKRNQKV